MYEVHAFKNSRNNEVVSMRDTLGKLAWQHLAEARANGFKRGAVWYHLNYVPVTFDKCARITVPGLGSVKTTMTLVEATRLLTTCNRYELRDHAFGDREVFWFHGGKEIASGYFSGSSSEVDIGEFNFTGPEALHLVTIGKTVSVERNDETGPNDYRDGEVMPGLTLEGVRKELTGFED